MVANTATSASFLVTDKFLEQVFNDKSIDLYNRGLTLKNKNITDNLAFMKKMEKSKVANTKLSLDLKSYAGIYNDKMIGNIFLKLNNGNLEIEFPHTSIFHGTLKHCQYDTFLVDWKDIRIPNGFLTFNFNTNREITGISLEEDNLLDVDFTELDIKKLETEKK